MPDMTQDSSARPYDEAATARLADRIMGGPLATKFICEALRDGANPNWRNADGVPLLNLLAGRDALDALETALAYGADIHATDRNGNTALFEAYRQPAALALLFAGADPGHRNDAGATACTHLPRTHTNMGYRAMVMRTANLLRDCQEIDTAAKHGRLSPKTYENLWPRNAFGHPPPISPVPENASLLYFLHRMEEAGQFMPKTALQEDTTAAMGIKKALSEDENVARRWQRHCDESGTPMTAADWKAANILNAMSKDQRVACLFGSDYWAEKADLHEFVELFEALPQHVFEQPSHRLETAVNDTLHAWLEEGAGKTLNTGALRHFHQSLPAQMREMFSGYYALQHERNSAESNRQAIGR